MSEPVNIVKPIFARTFEYRHWKFILEIRVMVRKGELWFLLADINRAISQDTSTTVLHHVGSGAWDRMYLKRPGGKIVYIVNEEGLRNIVTWFARGWSKSFFHWIDRNIKPAMGKRLKGMS